MTANSTVQPSGLLLLVAVFLLGITQTQPVQALVVATGSANISFDSGTPSPATTRNGSSQYGDYGGIVTNQDGNGRPQLTLSVADDTTTTEGNGAWNNAGQGRAPEDSYTFRHATGSNTRPDAFLLVGGLDTPPIITPFSPSEYPTFSITGLTWATRDRTGYGAGDDITLRIVDGANPNVPIVSGNLEALGGGLNDASLDGGGLFSDTITFDRLSGFRSSTDFRVQVDFSDGGWGAGAEGFWIDLAGAQLNIAYSVPEPSAPLLTGLSLSLCLLFRRRRK